MLVELRSLDEEPLEPFEDRRARSPPGAAGVEIEIVGRRPAGRLDRDAPLLAPFAPFATGSACRRAR